MKRILVCLILWCLIGSGQFRSQAQQTGVPPTAPKTATTPNATNGGSINGRVLDEEDQPLADVEIRPVAIGRAGVGSRPTVSDEEGRFSFIALPDTQYMFNVQAPGYIQPTGSTRAYRVGETATLKLLKGGVLTGRVTNARGEPVVAVSVGAQMIRNASSAAATERAGNYSYTQRTDDRGIYRLYGMQPGSYLVVANAPARSPTQTTSAYEKELPSYHPSGPRETAQAVEVRAGAEATGIDIRYLGERGQSISGTVNSAVAVASSGYVTVSLKRAGSEEEFASTNVPPTAANAGFVFQSVPDGEYEIIARRAEAQSNGALSAPRLVSIKGTDITGLTLTLLPLGSLAGRVVTADSAVLAACPNATAFTFTESAVFVRRAVTETTGQIETVVNSGRINPTGEFSVRGLAAGTYHLTLNPRGEHWYLQSIKRTVPDNTIRNGLAKETDLARVGVALKTGEDLAGITLTFAPGAATLLGQVRNATDSPLPKMLRVFVVPAEPNAKEDVLRYAETLVGNAEGRFGFNRLAPGRYRLYAEPGTPEEVRERRARLLVWESSERVRLQRLAQTLPEFELKACERRTDYELQLSAGK